jgi:ferredoxin
MRRARGVTLLTRTPVDHPLGNLRTLAPGVFALDDEEISVVVYPDAADIGKLRGAADACPTEAIRMGESPGDARD